MGDFEQKEEKMLSWTVELWNEFLTLPVKTQADVDDMRFHIHGIQRILASRRVFDEFNIKNNKVNQG